MQCGSAPSDTTWNAPPQRVTVAAITDDRRPESPEGPRNRRQCRTPNGLRAFRAPTSRKRFCGRARTATRSNGWSALAAHRRRDGAGDPADGDVPAALVSSEDSEAAGARVGAGRMRRSSGRPRGGVKRSIWRRSTRAADRGGRYQLKTLPRPTGKATEVIYTEYDLPQRTRQPHDVSSIRKGWRGMRALANRSSAGSIPRTGAGRIPDPCAETGGADRDPRRPVRQGREPVARDAVSRRHREIRSRDRDVSDVEPAAGLNGPHVQINQVSPDRSHLDGKVWLQDAGTYTVLRLDVASGTFEVFEPYHPETQRLRRDSRFAEQRILSGAGQQRCRADRRHHRGDHDLQDADGRLSPRRGMMDARIGSGSARTTAIGSACSTPGPRHFQEWPVPTPGRVAL